MNYALVKAAMPNPFFINSGPFNISEILKILKINLKIVENKIVKDIRDLLKLLIVLQPKI